MKFATTSRRAATATLVGLVAGALCVTASPALAQEDDTPWTNTSLSAGERADLLLAAMTFDEKISFVSNPEITGVSHIGIPRLGIPETTAIDGALGARVDVPSTLMPSSLGLASTRSVDLATEFGDVLGSETRATGNELILGPTADLVRVPTYGRAFESLSEDPLLTGLMGAAEIKAIQSNDVISEPKHWATNQQEMNRLVANATIGERPLQEIYLRAWEPIIRQGQPGAVMCAFNATNGPFSCGNEYLLNSVLKGQFGYRGFVQSDFNAAHSTLDANAGLDFEDPNTIHFGEQLRQAVLDGTVPESRLDDMVRRILFAYFDNGIMDSPTAGPTAPDELLDANAQVARRIGAAGMVLLQNEDKLLPLRTDGRRGIESVAVIGGDAARIIQGSGSAVVPNPARPVTIVDGITARAGSGVDVAYEPGVDPVSPGDMVNGPAPVPSSVLTPAGGLTGPGLHADIWANPGFQGDPTKIQVQSVDFATGIMTASGWTGQTQPPNFVSFAPMSAVFTGTLTAPVTGSYDLSLTHLGRATLTLDGDRIIDDPGARPTGKDFAVTTATRTLTAGEEYPVVITYANTEGGGNPGNGPINVIRFGWTPPADALSPAMEAAVEAAETADVAVIVANDFNSESWDRSDLSLPQDYDRLIRAVAAVNDNVVVVLATGGAVTMPWLDDVDGVLEAWYPGEQQGAALADVLFGDVNPAGRLPVTFPRSMAESPIDTDAQWPGTSGDNPVYSEGIFVGYRGHVAEGLDPLFAFGHGLSYSKVSYSRLKTSGLNASNPQSTASVTVTVRNRSNRVANQAVDVYAGRLPGNVTTAPRNLAGTTRVTVQPRSTVRVTIRLDRRAFQYWNTRTDQWVTPKGRVQVFVGGTSVDNGAVRARVNVF